MKPQTRNKQFYWETHPRFSKTFPFGTSLHSANHWDVTRQSGRNSAISFLLWSQDPAPQSRRWRWDLSSPRQFWVESSGVMITFHNRRKNQFIEICLKILVYVPLPVPLAVPLLTIHVYYNKGPKLDFWGFCGGFLLWVAGFRSINWTRFTGRIEVSSSRRRSSPRALVTGW